MAQVSAQNSLSWNVCGYQRPTPIYCEDLHVPCKLICHFYIILQLKKKLLFFTSTYIGFPDWSIKQWYICSVCYKIDQCWGTKNFLTKDGKNFNRKISDIFFLKGSSEITSEKQEISGTNMILVPKKPVSESNLCEIILCNDSSRHRKILESKARSHKCKVLSLSSSS